MAPRSSSSSVDRAPAGERRGLLPYIAAFKFLKAALLVVVGLGAFGLLSPSALRAVERWLAHLTSPHGRRLVQGLLARLLRMGPGKFAVVGVGAWLYAALFLVEGIGLWRQRRWAEYLTIVATASFIPFEVYELVKEVSVPRVSALALNVATVIYLIIRVWRTRHRHSPAAPHGARPAAA